MEKKSLIGEIKARKKTKGLTYAQLAEAIGASEVWTAHVLLGQAPLK